MKHVIMLGMKIRSRRGVGMGKVHVFTAAEQRAARSERIRVFEAEPYGWIAHSETGGERDYHLFRDPETKHLACTCADFIYRGNAEPGFECKHVSAVLKFIARWYLAHEYVCPTNKVA
jgi:hypothetical protein